MSVKICLFSTKNMLTDSLSANSLPTIDFCFEIIVKRLTFYRARVLDELGMGDIYLKHTIRAN